MGSSWNKRRLQRASAIGALLMLTVVVLAYQPLPQELYYWKESSEANLLDGCYHVYLDVGSNIGVQVRKLFQPTEYPGAGAIKVFREAFGEDDPTYICAVGFEPNPRHAPALKEIERAYLDCGWRAHFFAETAVSNYSGSTQFFTDNWLEYKEWGAGIVSDNVNTKKNSTATVKVLHLSEFVLQVVAKRKLPKAIDKPWSRQPTVLMKLDIEGSEIEVVPDLLLSGAFAHINATMIEWHERLAKGDERKKISRKLQAGLEALTVTSTRLRHLNLDDESYGYGKQKPMPNCSAEGSTVTHITISSNTVHKSTTNMSSATINLTITNPGKAKDTTSATRETQTRKCNTTSFLTVGVGGRLGNQMGEYATLLSHSLRLKMIPFIPKHQKIMLSAIFSHIPIQTWEELEEQGISLQNHSRELVHEWVLRNQATPSRVRPWLLSASESHVTTSHTCEELFKGTDAYVAKIGGYSNDVQLWPSNLAEIRHHFTIKQNIIDSVDIFLRQTASGLHGAGDGRRVFVGVHARRTDYKRHLKVLISGKLVTKKYFEDAMTFIKDKYRKDHVIFVMVSDNAKWMKNMFNGSQFEVVFSSSAHSPSISPPHFDMAVLSRCNHTIMSHGSFGLWSAYLAGGEVVVADGYSGESGLHKPNARAGAGTPGPLFPIEAAKVMNWTVIWDRCYKPDEGGVLTEECEKNKAKYGIED